MRLASEPVGGLGSGLMHRLGHVLLLLSALVGASCATTAERESTGNGSGAPCASIDLSSTLDPLAEWFDEGAGSVRLVTLLSPT